MELSASHIDGSHRGRPSLKDAVGETPCAGPDVNHPKTCRIDGEPLQRGFQLPSPTGHVPGWWASHHDGLPRADQSGSLVGWSPVHGHPSRLDHLTRRTTTVDQPASDEFEV